MQIHKYRVSDGYDVTIHMPEDAKVLKFDVQDGNLCIWVLEDNYKPSVGRHFKIIEEGTELYIRALKKSGLMYVVDPTQMETMEYIGTIPTYGCEGERHLFEVLD